MKANLNELRELVLFSEDKNTSFRIAMIKLMEETLVEGVSNGTYDLEEAQKFNGSFFKKNDDIIKGVDFLLDVLEFDENEVFEIEL